MARRDLQQQRQRAKSGGIFVFCPSVSTPRLGGAFPSFELLYYRQMPSSIVKEAATNLQLGNNMDIQFNFLAFEHKPSTLSCLPESKTQPPYFPRLSPTNSFCYFGMFICCSPLATRHHDLTWRGEGSERAFWRSRGRGGLRWVRCGFNQRTHAISSAAISCLDGW